MTFTICIYSLLSLQKHMMYVKEHQKQLFYRTGTAPQDSEILGSAIAFSNKI